MILKLRQRHRRMMLLLGVLLPIAFVVGIAARKPVPDMKTLPAGLAESAQKYPVVKWDEYANFFDKVPMNAQLRREQADAGGFALVLSTRADFVKPDVLVYWIAGEGKVADKLPENATLLGAFDSPVTLPLPGSVAAGKGRLLLYSLATQQVLDVSRPFAMEKP
jgi:hypothetical protein